MADVETIINDAVSEAQTTTTAALTEITTALSAVKSLITFSNIDITDTTFGSVVNKINNFLDDLKYNIDVVADKPDGLVVFTMPPIPAFNEINITPIKERIDAIFPLIDTIPSRISNAITIIDLVTGKIDADLVNGGYGIDDI